MIRLGIGGPRIVEDDGWAALRQEFARRHCVVLEGFVDKGVLERVPRMLEAGRFHACEHVNPTGKGRMLARELRMEDTERLPQMFMQLLNQPRLFDAIAGLTGCDVAIRCFSGRCYKQLADSDHFTTWHDDAPHRTGRLLGLTIDLSPEPSGGGFQIRWRKTGEVLRTVSGTRLGDACLFRIDGSLQHRALVPEEGTAPRCVYGGWFQGAGPDYREYVRGMRYKAVVHEATACEPSGSSAR